MIRSRTKRLRAEADRHADDAGAGQQRADVHADLGQHHHAGDDQDGDRQRRAQQRQQGAQPRRPCRLRLARQPGQMPFDRRVDRLPDRQGQQNGDRELTQAGQHAPAKLGRQPASRSVPSPQSCSSAIAAARKISARAMLSQHRVIEREPRLDPGITRNRFGPRHQHAIERAEDRRSARGAPPRAPRRRCRSSAASADSRAAPLPPRRARAPRAAAAPASARSAPASCAARRSGRLPPLARATACRTARRCCSTMMPRKTWSTRPTAFSSASCAVSDRPKQQADLGDRVAEHAHHRDPPGPARGVGGGAVRDRQQAQPRLAGREHHPRDAEDGGAQRVGIDHRQQDEARQGHRRPARSPRADGRRPGSRAPAAAPGRSGRAPAARGAAASAPRSARRCGGSVSPLSARASAFFLRRRPAVRRPADQRQDGPPHRAARSPTRPRGPAASTSARRQAASSRTPRAHGSVAMHLQPAPQHAARCGPPRARRPPRSDMWFRKPEAPTSTSAPRLFGASAVTGGRIGGGRAWAGRLGGRLAAALWRWSPGSRRAGRASAGPAAPPAPGAHRPG